MKFNRKILSYNPKLKASSKKLRQNMTFSEVILWNELKQKKTGFDFSRQRPIDEFIVDFYCKDLMLAIQIDSESHHHETIDKKDVQRQRRLKKLGVRFLRFDDIAIKQKLSDVLSTLHYWIDEHKFDLVGREPSPNPSKEGNESAIFPS